MKIGGLDGWTVQAVLWALSGGSRPQKKPFGLSFRFCFPLSAPEKPFEPSNRPNREFNSFSRGVPTNGR